MKNVFALAVLLLPIPVKAQKVAGVDAPDAITLRVTQVTAVSTPEQLVAGSTTITESSDGNTIVAESATTRYTLSCIVVRRTESGTGDEKVVTIDGSFKNYPNGITWVPMCEGFHVGDVVTFYSLEHLIWLSYTRGGTTYTHNENWKPNYPGDRFYTMRYEWTMDLSKYADISEQAQRDAGLPVMRQPRSHHYIMYEHPYAVASEEEKPKDKQKYGGTARP
jgi:hypothetical protein